MQNSVALGYQSTTKYFYDLDGYVPEGSSYKIANDNAVGIISVGGWDKKSAVGLRRIVNVAPGALDSDVATVGQLKALQYINKEGLVVYYTEEVLVGAKGLNERIGSQDLGDKIRFGHLAKGEIIRGFRSGDYWGTT
ncbi:hypothetical protein [Histophilus somni]|uniref:hypothetical protein n=1 Tax=Histophilus somni TaxID=731 RepID=UPI0018EB5CD0|nr:hypothetical protein [Histophilus somni]QQF78338.1 hypothetical protein JFL53_07330 [Histophilus somni]